MRTYVLRQFVPPLYQCLKLRQERHLCSRMVLGRSAPVPGNAIRISLTSRRDVSRIAQPFKVGYGDFTIAQVPQGRLNAYICPASVRTTIVPVSEAPSGASRR